MFIKYFALNRSQTDGMRRKLEVIKRNNEMNESCIKHHNTNGNNHVVLMMNISTIIFTMREFNCLCRNMEDNSYIVLYFYVCVLTNLSSPILFHNFIKHKVMTVQYLISRLVWNRNDYLEWSTLLQELNPNGTIEILIEIVRIVVIQIVVNKQLEYQQKSKKRKEKADTTSPLQQQTTYLILFDAYENGDGERSMDYGVEDEEDNEFAAGVARPKQVVNPIENANNNSNSYNCAAMYSCDATASAGNQLGLIHSLCGANNNHNINNINNNNSTKNENNNKNCEDDGNNDMDDCQHSKRNEKTKIQTNKNHKSPNSKSKKNNNINNKENHINNNKRRNNQANSSAVGMYANRTDEDVTSHTLKPADDSDDNEETYTLNYDHIDVTKGGVSNTASADLTTVTNNTNWTINTNTYATRLSKTIKNTYGGLHMSNKPVHGDYSSNTYSMNATLGLKAGLTNNNKVSSYDDCSNNTDNTNTNNSNDDFEGKYNNNDSVDSRIAVAETLRQLNGGYSVIAFGAEIGAGNVAINPSSHSSTPTTNTHIVNTINASNKTLFRSSDMTGASLIGMKQDLKEIGVFASRHHELLSLTHACETQVYKEGDCILEEKHAPDHDLHIIQSSTASLTKGKKENKHEV